MSGFKAKTVHLSGKGFKKVLGELEAEILEQLWKQSPASVRQVRDRLAANHRDLSFNAVMTIMNRLVEKGILDKKEADNTYQYSPTYQRSDFSRLVAKDILSAVLRDATLFSAASLTDLADDLDKETLRRLRQFIG